jgi:GNAT superfamily N-acetyltransferase
VTKRTVSVHPVDPGGLHEVAALWLAARVEAGASREAAVRAIADGRLGTALGRPGVRSHVALVGGEPVGYVVTSDNPFGLNPSAELVVEQLWVAPSARRHGVARALLGAVLGCAERAGCDTVVSNVPTASRDAHRFFARLGFASVVVRRVVSTGALRRRLAPSTVEAGSELLRRRRSLRQRAYASNRSA